MFYVLSKVIGFFVHPVTILLLLLLLWRRGKSPKRRRIFKWSFIALAFGFTSTPITQGFKALWIPDSSQQESQVVKAVVVLGGYTRFDEQGEESALSKAGDRIWKAMKYWGLADTSAVLILSGTYGSLGNGFPPESMAVKDHLGAMGMDTSRVIAETKSLNTRENAEEAVRILDSLGISEGVHLVTSGTHMRRSQAIFEKLGLVVNPVIAETPEPIEFYEYIVPNLKNIEEWKLLMHEWVGYVTYAMMGYL